RPSRVSAEGGQRVFADHVDAATIRGDGDALGSEEVGRRSASVGGAARGDARRLPLRFAQCAVGAAAEDREDAHFGGGEVDAATGGGGGDGRPAGEGPAFAAGAVRSVCGDAARGSR